MICLHITKAKSLWLFQTSVRFPAILGHLTELSVKFQQLNKNILLWWKTRTSGGSQNVLRARKAVVCWLISPDSLLVACDQSVFWLSALAVSPSTCGYHPIVLMPPSLLSRGSRFTAICTNRHNGGCGPAVTSSSQIRWASRAQTPTGVHPTVCRSISSACLIISFAVFPIWIVFKVNSLWRLVALSDRNGFQSKTRLKAEPVFLS